MVRHIPQSIHNYFRFLRSVLRFVTSYWFSGAGINAKLVVQDWLSIPFLVRSTPILYDDICDYIICLRVKFRSDVQVLLELFLM